MFAIADELAAILSTVRRPGDFFVSGSQLLHAPRIEIAGVGVVSLPLPAEQARQLVAVAARAPYGRGSETLVDTDVRRTWQIDAGQVGISGRHWPATLAEIVARCADGLGIQESVSAEFYKLLIYDTGSFFVNHRDTEKAPGMFATLVIVLPSPYTGGELVVRHRQREVSLDLSGDDAAEARFAGLQVLPKPPHWGGYLVRPLEIEFWQGRMSRLHDRIVYTKTGEVWSIGRLAP